MLLKIFTYFLVMGASISILKRNGPLSLPIVRVTWADIIVESYFFQVAREKFSCENLVVIQFFPWNQRKLQFLVEISVWKFDFQVARLRLSGFSAYMWAEIHILRRKSFKKRFEWTLNENFYFPKAIYSWKWNYKNICDSYGYLRRKY